MQLKVTEVGVQPRGAIDELISRIVPVIGDEERQDEPENDCRNECRHPLRLVLSLARQEGDDKRARQRQHDDEGEH